MNVKNSILRDHKSIRNSPLFLSFTIWIWIRKWICIRIWIWIWIWIWRWEWSWTWDGSRRIIKEFQMSKVIFIKSGRLLRQCSQAYRTGDGIYVGCGVDFAAYNGNSQQDPYYGYGDGISRSEDGNSSGRTEHQLIAHYRCQR